MTPSPRPLFILLAFTFALAASVALGALAYRACVAESPPTADAPRDRSAVEVDR